MNQVSGIPENISEDNDEDDDDTFRRRFLEAVEGTSFSSADKRLDTPVVGMTTELATISLLMMALKSWRTKMGRKFLCGT